jgi:beta-lactamase class A
VNFTPVRKLTVWRTFSDGQTTDVLAERAGLQQLDQTYQQNSGILGA